MPKRRRPQSPYAIGREQVRGLERADPDFLRELVRLGEERVENAKPHEIEAAVGLLAGYREALEQAEAREPDIVIRPQREERTG